MHLGADDPFVASFSVVVAPTPGASTGGGGVPATEATLVTAPFVSDDHRDHVEKALRPTSLVYRLRRGVGWLNALALPVDVPAGSGAAAVAGLRRAFEERRDVARALDSALFLAQPDMAGMREASEHELAGRASEAIVAARRSLHRLPRSASPRATDAFARVGSSVARMTGRTRQALMLLAVRRTDDGRRLLLNLENEVAAPDRPGHPRQIGDVRLMLTMAMDAIGDADATADYLASARSAYVACGADDGVANCDEARRLLDAHADVPVDRIWDAWTRWSGPAGEAGPTAPRATPEGEEPSVQSALPLWAMLRSALESEDLDSVVGTVGEAAADMARTGLAPTAEVGARGIPLVRRFMELQRSGTPVGTGDWQDAAQASLSWALEMLREVDRQPVLESVADRQRWAESVSTVLVGAIVAAVAADRPRLAPAGPGWRTCCWNGRGTRACPTSTAPAPPRPCWPA